MELYQRQPPAEAEVSAYRPKPDQPTLPPFPVLLRVRNFARVTPDINPPPAADADPAPPSRSQPSSHGADAAPLAVDGSARGKRAAALFLLCLAGLAVYFYSHRSDIFRPQSCEGSKAVDLAAPTRVPPILPPSEIATPETEPARAAQLEPIIVPLDPEDSP